MSLTIKELPIANVEKPGMESTGPLPPIQMRGLEPFFSLSSFCVSRDTNTTQRRRADFRIFLLLAQDARG
jgi:hypothetical protein